MKEICSCCGAPYTVKFPMIYKPSAWINRERLPACYHCNSENFNTIFRFVFGFKYGIERTNTGDQTREHP